jgi:pyruvate ferredoxin oxidoreductase beta subunit/phenylglyoxylate dehydrogenase beta subunit
MTVVEFLAQAEDLVSPGLSACQGCAAELALRTAMKVIGPKSVVGIPPGCVAGFGAPGWGLKTGMKVPVCMPLLGNSASLMSGIKQAYAAKDPEVRVVAFAGDGATVDAGFQCLSAAAERRENIIYICYDNEGYMNTGFQKSGTTPHGAHMSTTPSGSCSQGNAAFKKDLPLMLAMQDAAYVATLSVSHIPDFVDKLKKACEVTDGLSYLHILSPCPTGWGTTPELSIEYARKAVETLYFPLYEYSRGTFTISKPTLRAAAKAKPVSEFLAGQRRFRHLCEADALALQEHVDRKWGILRRLAG